MFGINCTGQSCDLVAHELTQPSVWKKTTTVQIVSLSNSQIPAPAAVSAVSSALVQAAVSLFTTTSSVKFAGDLTLGDFDADGYYDILQPLCEESNCQGQSIKLAITTRTVRH